MFNARLAAALKPGEHLTIDGTPGLRLVATASRRTWTYRFKSPVDGRMRQIKLGQWPAMPPAAALAAWDGARLQRSGGTDPAIERRAQRAAAAAGPADDPDAYTVRRLCDDYLAGYRGDVTPAGHREKSRLLRVELAPIEAVPAWHVTRTQAFELIHAMRDRPVIACRLRQSLGAAWDAALDAGRLPPDTPNWWRLVLKGKLASKGRSVGGKSAGTGKRTLDAAEVGALLRWLPTLGENAADVLTLYLWTCCRGAEIVAMERGEISEETDGVWWTIPRNKLKMRRNSRTVDLRVPLVGRALAIVQRRLEATRGRALFPGSGAAGHLAQISVGHAVYRHQPYCRFEPDAERPRLPVTHWVPHDLRRTGRTMLAGMGCPAEVAEAILGHLQPGVQGVYDRHSYNAERRAWLTALAARLDGLAGG